MDLNAIINEDTDLDDLQTFIEEQLSGEIPYHSVEIMPLRSYIVICVFDKEDETMVTTHVNYGGGTTIGKLITYLINNAE